MDKEDLRVAAGHQGRATSLSGQGRKLPETLLQDDEYAVISDAPGYFERSFKNWLEFGIELSVDSC